VTRAVRRALAILAAGAPPACKKQRLGLRNDAARAAGSGPPG